MNLSLFNEANGIYPGTNTPQFTQLEYLLNTSKNVNISMPSLGLFGEASTGKTTTAKLLAMGGDYHFLNLNSSQLTINTLNTTICNPIYKNLTYNEYIITKENSNSFVFETKRPILILLDEAHKLSKSLQTFLLTAIDNKGPLFDIDIMHECSINTNNIIWVFATTDSSKLLYSLSTRLFNVIFDQYTVEDIMNIIKLHYKNIEEGGLKYLANCSKLVPRIALRYADQLIKTNTEDNISNFKVEKFITGFLNMNLMGIDSIDKRILLYLYNNKKIASPSDIVLLTGFKNTLNRLEQKSLLSLTEHKEYNKCLFNISRLSQKIDITEYITKSRQDISLSCRILDLADLEIRLSFLEKLGMVIKTPKGIVLKEQYLE